MHAGDGGREQELFKRLREGRQAKKARVKCLGEYLPDFVTMNGVLELPYCPNSGSDFTVIGRSHWEQLRAADPTVMSEKLDVPVKN